MDYSKRKLFSQIYDQYINKIYRFIFLKVNSQEVAEDLCSETFLKGWQAFNEQNSQIKNFQAFLYRIAKNLVIDFYRENGHNRTVDINCVAGVADPKIDLEKQARDNSDIRQIGQAIANLKPDYQDVLIFRYLDDLSVPEIAEITQKSEGAIRTTLSRALKALKLEMENNKNKNKN